MYRLAQQSPFLKLFQSSIVAACVTLAGCSSSPKELNPDPELKEIKAEKKNDIDSPEGALFESAKKSYQNRLFSVAKDQFTALMNNFPTGPYAEFSEMKIADCAFFTKDFDISAGLYEEYAKNHPGSLSAAYALLMSARSFHLSSKGVGHDAHALERAREMYTRLIEQYPDSVYSRQASIYQQATIADLTANEMRVAEFYRKQGKEDAYNARLKIIREKWQPLAKDNGTEPEMIVAAESLPAAEPVSAEDPAENENTKDTKDMIMASAAIGATGDIENRAPENRIEAKEDAAEEIEVEDEETSPEDAGEDVDEPDIEVAPAPEEHDDDEEAEDEEDADEEDTDSDSDDADEDEEIQEHQEQAQSAPADEMRVSSQRITRPVPVPEGPQSVKLIAPPSRQEITRVECADSAIYLHLDRPWQDRGYLSRNTVLEPLDGIVSLPLPLTRAEEKTYNCFGISDLNISSNGTLTLESTKPMFVRAMVNPARLALISKNFSWKPSGN